MKVYINGQDLAYQCGWEVSNEPIDVTPMTTIDPDREWTYTDSQGHWHAFSDDKETILPTLFRRQTDHEHQEPPDEDGWVETWTSTEVTWHCRICAEVVTPKWIERTNTHRVLMPGRMSWRVEVRAVGDNCEILHELDSQQVSVRLIDGNHTLFGVGLLKELGASPSSNGHRWFGCVYGNGALGTREERA